MSSAPEIYPRRFSFKPFSDDQACTHIRVLQIKQGLGQQISCVMKTVRRPTKRSEFLYSCLSYTWSPDTPKHLIFIEGERVNEGATEVGNNLRAFLTAARDANVTGWLWIDALCINQHDIIEREQQVKQMGKIYEQAEKVYIWLGIELMNRVSMDAMEDITKALRQAEAEDWRTILSSMAERRAFLDKLNLSREDLASTMRQILTAPYWTRLWIAQEFLLNHKPILFFPKCQISAIVFAMLPSICLYEVPGSSFETLPGWKYFWWRRADPGPHFRESVSLASLIPEFVKSGCRDKRDRIYALLSLADDGDPELINCSIGREDVFRNTMALMRRQERTLDELLLIGEALIEALELWPASEASSSILEISFPNTENISPPVWSQASLEIIDAAGSKETTEVTCMYVGVRDGPDLHVFEYALDVSAERPIVKYSRAHEYVRERSLACTGPISDNGVQYFWLEGMPSEAVHYFGNPDVNPRKLST